MKKIHLTVIILFSILLIGSASYGLLYMYVNQPALPKDVRVGEWSLEGMNRKEVQQALDARLKQLKEWPVTLKVEDPAAKTMTFTAAQTGANYSADDFRAAVQQLDEGNLWERAYARYHFTKEWSLKLTYNSKSLQEQLNPAWEKETFGSPADAVRRITASDKVQYIPEKGVRRIAWDELANLMQAKLHRDFAALDHDVKPNPLLIQLPLYTLQPEVTLKSLRQEGIDRKIIQFSTSLGNSSEGRIHNVSAAAQAVNGLILPPNGTFDYEKVIRKAEKEYGFREAPVIVNGQLTPGIGGGICQVSSTVYNAALLTGLDIVERRNHSLPVKYLPKGLDATFASGSINFRFKNNTGKSLLIHAKVEGGRLTVKFFGTFPENVSYALESRTIETLSVPVKYVSSNVLPDGAQQVLQNGQPGYIVETMRTKRVDGKIVESKTITRDTYKAQNRLIARSGHANLPDPKEPSVVEDGISDTKQP
ncbi:MULTISPECIES: VanW family protein [unclassified Paenibacillus]|uniref:VanW family protein n=1 Tax=unclassified Paenibacillus TaxID=185978 RepID=UPI0004274BE8|nr:MULTISPECIES: VanW family protein [unclassified Paenibacillus]KGP80849.1 vancomycin resistance protein [Paenibacillus sp. MAEPY2]KGP88049.1 vancomycin resistance protein [Paenibacillus sp. MAEPY1]